MKKLNSIFNNILETLVKIDVNGVIEEYEVLKDELDKAKKDLANEISTTTRFTTQVEMIKTELDNVKMKLSDSKSNEQELKTQINTLNTELSSLRSNLSLQEQKIADYYQLKSTHEEVLSQLSNANNKIKKLEKQIEDKNTILSALRKEDCQMSGNPNEVVSIGVTIGEVESANDNIIESGEAPKDTNSADEAIDNVEPANDNTIESEEEFDFIDEDTYSDILILAQKFGIPSVFDVKENRYYDSTSFFKKDESELILWRRVLEEAIKMDKPRLICPKCKQKVKLSGHKTRRGHVCYFSHIKDSDKCSYKTTTNKTKKQIEIEKYGLVQESDRHKVLKELIKKALEGERSKKMGVTNVTCEKRISSQLPYLNYRKPDICADWNGRHLVFELQLSTTFVSVIVDRDIFYRLNNYDIIWVFNFDANEEYVNLFNLMCKDIYYANKRNVFIFDKEAQLLSKEKGELILKCRWLEANNKWSTDKLITLSDLLFDEEYHKPYIYDADKLYFEKNPNTLQRRLAIENSRESIIKALFEREEREKEFNRKKEYEITQLKSLIWQNNESVESFKVKSKYGFKYDDKVILSPQYTSVVQDSGYFIVGFNKKNGIVRRDGVQVVPIEYKKYIIIDNCFDVVIAMYKTIDLFIHGQQYSIEDSFDEKKQVIDCEKEDNIVKYILKTNRYSRYSHNYYTGYYSQSSRTLLEFITDDDFIQIQGPGFNIISSMLDFIDISSFSEVCSLGFNNLFAVSKKEEHKYGIIDLRGHTVLDFKFEKLYKTNSEFVICSQLEKLGIIDCFGNQYSDCFAKKLAYLGKDYFAYSNSDKWGICNKFGEQLTEEKYTFIRVTDDDNILVAFTEQFRGKWHIDQAYISYPNNDDYFCLSTPNGKLHYNDSLHDGYIIRKSGGLCCLLRYDETVILEYDFLSIDSIGNNIFITHDIEHKLSIYNANTETLSNKFEDISIIDEQTILYKRNGKYALGNTLEILTDYYDEIVQICPDHFITKTIIRSYNYNNQTISNVLRFINSKGEYLSEHTFDSVSDFHEKVAQAVYHGRNGIIDINGNFIEEFCKKIGDNLSVFKQFERYYLKNSIGDVVSSEFVSYSLICEEYLSLKQQSNEYKIYNINNNEETSDSFIEINVITSIFFRARVSEGWYLLKGTKKVYDDVFYEIRFIEREFVGLCKLEYKAYKYKEKWNIGNLDGRFLLDLSSDECPIIKDGMIQCVLNGYSGLVDMMGKRQYVQVFKGDEYIIKERFGEYCLESIDGTIYIDFNSRYKCIKPLTNKYVSVINKKNYYALYKIGERFITTFIYTSITYNEIYNCFDVNKDGADGRIDGNGKDIDVERNEVFEGKFVIVKQFEKYGIRDERESLVVECIYKSIIAALNETFIVEEDIDKWSLIDSKGTRLTKKDYQRIYMANDQIMAKRNNLIGALNIDGNEISKEKSVSNGYKIVKCFEKQSIYSNDGTIHLSGEFDAINELGKGFFSTKKQDKIALSTYNTILTEFKYKAIETIGNGYFAALYSVTKITKKRKTGYGYKGNPYTYWDTDISHVNKWGVLNSKGQVILSFNYDTKPRFEGDKLIVEKQSEKKKYTKEQLYEKEKIFTDFEIGKEYEATVTGFAKAGVIMGVNGKKIFLPKKVLYTSTKQLSKGISLFLIFKGYAKSGYPTWETKKKC